MFDFFSRKAKEAHDYTITENDYQKQEDPKYNPQPTKSQDISELPKGKTGLILFRVHTIKKYKIELILKTHKALFCKYLFKQVQKIIKPPEGCKILRPSQNFIRNVTINDNKSFLNSNIFHFLTCSPPTLGSINYDKFIEKRKQNSLLLTSFEDYHQFLDKPIKDIWENYLINNFEIDARKKIKDLEKRKQAISFNPIEYFLMNDGITKIKSEQQ